MGGLTSSFKLINYKIDQISFETPQNLTMLRKSKFDKIDWKMTVGFAAPKFYVEKNLYVFSMQIKLNSQNGNDGINLVVCITGLFSFDESTKHEIPNEIKQKVIKNQFPAILFPYVRSAITGILAFSGIGGFVLPLVNMNAVAEETLKDVTIEIIK